MAAEVELGPDASVVDCDVEDAVAFASWSVRRRDNERKRRNRVREIRIKLRRVNVT